MFIGSVAAATVSLLVAALLLSWEVRQRQRGAIERRLSDEARVVADVISAESVDDASLDREADRVGRFIASRVTFIAEDGRVVGDSTQSGPVTRTPCAARRAASR